MKSFMAARSLALVQSFATADARRENRAFVGILRRGELTRPMRIAPHRVKVGLVASRP